MSIVIGINGSATSPLGDRVEKTLRLEAEQVSPNSIAVRMLVMGDNGWHVESSMLIPIKDFDAFKNELYTVVKYPDKKT